MRDREGRDEWCGESLAGHMQGLCHCPEIQALRQQLAEITKERDEAVEVARSLVACGPITQEDIDWAANALNGGLKKEAR